MKKITLAALALFLLAAGARPARAEEEKKDHEKDHAARMEHMLKERLGLSDDQAAKLKSAWEAHKTAEKALREKQRESARKLEEEVRGMASDKEIQATLDELDSGRKSMQAERQKLESAVASALKPYQRAKLRLLMQGMMKRHMMHGRFARGHERGEERGRREWGEHERRGHEAGWRDHDEDGGGPDRDDRGGPSDDGQDD